MLYIQVRSENQPVANESAKGSTDHIPQTRGRAGSTSSIVRKLFVKPKQLQRIHSGTISKEERHNTLAPFAIPGIAIGQVNRNYEAFFKTAWGSSPTSAPKTSAANLLQPSASSALVQPHTQHGQAEREHREGSRRERRTDQPSRPHRPTNIAGGGCVRAFTSVDDLKEKPSSSRSPSRSPQLRKARQLNAPEVGTGFSNHGLVNEECT